MKRAVRKGKLNYEFKTRFKGDVTTRKDFTFTSRIKLF